MVRATITFPQDVHEELRREAFAKRTSLSRVVVERVKPTAGRGGVSGIYKGLRKMRGIGPKGIKDAASTIDKVLYG